MFNLEQAIADWRQNMLACGIETPVPLEELELHLREEIERNVKAGMEQNSAFETAVQSIGDARMLIAEFKKLPEKPRAKFFRIAQALIYLYFGVSFICMAYTLNLSDIIHDIHIYTSKGSLFELFIDLGWGILWSAAGVSGVRSFWRLIRNQKELAVD